MAAIHKSPPIKQVEDLPAILHMDFRPANLLSQAGRVRAVVDWSNMLIGDPILGLARIAEYGLLDQPFLFTCPKCPTSL